MKYDFETLVPRKNTGSMKWNGMYSLKNDIPDDIVPLSVADMEFKNAPEITEGLKKYLDTAILGYTEPTEEYYDALSAWTKARHGYEVKKEEVLTSPGVIPAFVKATGALTQKGDSVMFLTPAYPPFWSAGETNGINVVEVPLVPDGSTYTVDYEAFEAAASRPDVKVFILCNPHNPIGKVWLRVELMRMLDICMENGVVVISDEIHSDIIMPGVHHTSVGALDEEYRRNAIICTAPSKTFNLAGMQTSNIIVPDPELRKRVSCVNTYLTALGYEACRIAYTSAGKWLDEMIVYVNENYHFVCDFLSSHLPKIKPCKLEGTYLMWLDMRELGYDEKELERINIEHDLFLDEGYIFGNEGKGFERLNLACPRHVLEKALLRLEDAYK